MPLPSIKEIRDLAVKKKQDMTQKEFANQVGVEVTWLNKFIKGKIENPEYQNMRKIYNHIEKISAEILDPKFTIADKICAHSITTIKLGTKIKQVSIKLSEKKFNQAPVTTTNPKTHAKKIIGVITTRKINELNQDDNFDRDTLLAIEHIDTYLPRIPYDFPARNLGCYLKDSQCILVTKGDNQEYGIITDEDMLKLLLL